MALASPFKIYKKYCVISLLPHNHEHHFETHTYQMSELRNNYTILPYKRYRILRIKKEYLEHSFVKFQILSLKVCHIPYNIKIVNKLAYSYVIYELDKDKIVDYIEHRLKSGQTPSNDGFPIETQISNTMLSNSSVARIMTPAETKNFIKKHPSILKYSLPVNY